MSKAVLQDKLFEVRKDKNDLYYIPQANIAIWRILEKWSEIGRDYTTKHPRKDMVHILGFFKLQGIELSLETEMWIAKGE